MGPPKLGGGVWICGGGFINHPQGLPQQNNNCILAAMFNQCNKPNLHSFYKQHTKSKFSAKLWRPLPRCTMPQILAASTILDSTMNHSPIWKTNSTTVLLQCYCVSVCYCRVRSSTSDSSLPSWKTRKFVGNDPGALEADGKLILSIKEAIGSAESMENR